MCRNAEALIIRTRTVCNKDMLESSKVKFIATTTIGYDHIDTVYCEQAGIGWAHAPGCNAKSVEQYIASALFSYTTDRGITIHDQTIGIVGVGNVGKNVEQLCKTIGMQVLLNDPPRERLERSNIFVSLQEIQRNASIITFHVPLTRAGRDATYHMVNRKFIDGLQQQPLLINSSRGEIFDSYAIKEALRAKKISGFIADCWENEPDIDRELLYLSDYGTPHIAGYSRDGKANGTKAAVQSLSRFFHLGIDDWEPPEIELPKNPNIIINGFHRQEASIIAETVLSTHDIRIDDKAFKNDPLQFEKLRGNYRVRREFSSYIIEGKNISKSTQKKLQTLGFNYIDGQ